MVDIGYGHLDMYNYTMDSGEVQKQHDDGLIMMRIRNVQRMLNVIGVCYYMSVTICGAFLEWFVILPELSRVLGFSVVIHRTFMLYLFVNAMGNYLLTSFRDVRFKRRRHHQSSRLPRDRQRRIPFRAHFCKVCNQCVLKRDHHCFIIGKCIGYHNQKHFIYCSVYTATVSIYALITTAIYMHLSFKTKFLGAFTFFTLLPSSLEGWFRGLIESQELLLVIFLYVCITGALGGLGLFTWQMFIVAMGLTTHEAVNGERGTETTIWENFTDTFGKYWLIGMICPLPLPQYGTGMYESKENLPYNHFD